MKRVIEIGKKLVLVVAAVVTLAGGALAFERFDRDSVLPVIAQVMKQVRADLKDFSKEFSAAKQATGRLKQGYKSLPAGQREAGKAQDLVRLEESCDAMDQGLEKLKGVFGDLKGQVQNGLLPKFEELAKKIEGLAKHVQGQLAEKVLAASVMDRVEKLAGGSLSKEDKRAIGQAEREVERRQALLSTMKRRQARITRRQGVVEDRLEQLEIVIAALDLKQAEVQLNRTLARALQAEHQTDLLARELFGVGGATKILKDDSLETDLDEIFDAEPEAAGFGDGSGQDVF